MDILQPKYSIYALTIVLLCTFLVFGSSLLYEQTPKESEFKGVYISGFENTTFKPCEVNEIWWAELNDTSGEWYALKNKYDSLVTEKKRHIFLVVKGFISERGKHGHLGMWDRTLKITKVVSASAAFPQDCAPDESSL